MAPKAEYQTSTNFVVAPTNGQTLSKTDQHNTIPVTAPSVFARYACVAVLCGVIAVWCRLSFVEESTAPAIGSPMHDYKFPLLMTVAYLGGLPLLRMFSQKYLSQEAGVDAKALLKETMVVYNASQVLLNVWMVYRFLRAVLFDGHPFIYDQFTVTSGTTFAVWIHYTDKYMEFFDTIFMVLRGRMDQVSFLHVYHHTTIVWAWWLALHVFPGGDVYFGALLNSSVHVLMYSYYTLSLLKVPCPWKRYLTQAQLVQFMTVNVYTAVACYDMYRKGAPWSRFLGAGVQVFEMTSLLILFMHFYAAAYQKKSKSSKQHLDKETSRTKIDEASETRTVSSSSSVSSDEASDEDTKNKKDS